MQNQINNKLAYSGNYNSCYDYTIYDIAFVFADEEEIEEDVSGILQYDNLEIDFPNSGGNIH